MERDECKKRLIQVLKPVGEVVIIGAAYLIFMKLTDLAIPCIIYKITGKYCPGCGITRMLLAMLRLDFAAALRWNCLLFFLLPCFLVYGLWKGICFIKTGKKVSSLAEQIGVMIVFVLVVAFWIMRNLPQFAFLAPRG